MSQSGTNENTTPEEAAELTVKLKKEIRKAFVGGDRTLNLLLAGLFGGLHVLIEDIPGVGKTTLARSLSLSAGLDFGRVQFTPDLLPGDITGVTIWSQESRTFVFRPGAIMHQFILADEVNRASSRTQAALLEAMQEQAVTVDGTTYLLPEPFMVVATQNPVSFTGTFALPEAQIDRFGIALSLGYPAEIDEIGILDRFQDDSQFDRIEAVCEGTRIGSIRNTVRGIRVDEKVKRFLISIADRTRHHPLLKLGMSPRATQHLMRGCQAHAILEGRSYVIPEDVLDMVEPCLSHRLVPTAEARMENRSVSDILSEIMSRVEKPAGY
ncbi:MAG TPA: AAA family ATPase [Spirochaetia bacterium]|nr:AAA family ATPase [Spirochaetia bacterium]